MKCFLPLAVVVWVLGSAQAQAQEGGSPESLDEEARAVFSAGSTAFDDARYDDALTYFQRAFELSQRSVLLYNVGVAADRLRRDRVALEAFERFLEEVPEHPRRRDVEARVIVLRQIVADADAAHGGEPTESTGGGSTGTDTPVPPPAPPDQGPDALSIAGPIVLGTLGLAGLVTSIVGIAGAGECLATGTGGVCIEERQTAWVGVGVWGGLGLASIAGAVIWAIVAMSGGGPDDDAPVAVTPNGLAFRWSN